MDANSIVTIIGNFGFPIAMCLYLVYVNQKMQENHKEEIDKLRKTVENNTEVMIKICTKLGIDN